MSAKLPISNEFRSAILEALRTTEMKQVELGERLGKSRSWTTKLLNGSLKSLSEEDWDAICETLGIKFELVESDPFPTSFHTLKNLCSDRPDRLELIDGIVSMFESQTDHHSLPYIPTDDLVAFGEEMVRAAHEDPEKPGKVGRIGIVWMSKLLERLNKPTEIDSENPTLTTFGGVAAGSGFYTDEVRETIVVDKEYPDDHFALQVCGDSMDNGKRNGIPDGSTIIVKRLPEGAEPISGKIYVVSDGNGSVLKIYKGKKLGSLNPKYKDFEPLDGAMIQAQFVKVLP